MPFLILSVLLQLAFVLHILKTGRNTTWIWIVVMLPMAGSLAYLIMEVIPDVTNSRMGRRASRKIEQTINPNKHINEAARRFSVSDTVENTLRLAEECYNKGLFNEAKGLYEKCLSGVHADDPDLMFGLAKTEFALNNYTTVKTLLDKLIEVNPDYKNQDAHLLYARTLHQLDQRDAARHEYETLHTYFTGPESDFYYAQLLREEGKESHAQTIFQEILTKAKNSGRHYNTLHRDIIRQVKTELCR